MSERRVIVYPPSETGGRSVCIDDQMLGTAYWRTCYNFMARWAAAGAVGQIRDQMRKRIRREMGRSPGAVATVIDSQSVRPGRPSGRTPAATTALRKSTDASATWSSIPRACRCS